MSRGWAEAFLKRPWFLRVDQHHLPLRMAGDHEPG